MSHNDKPDYKVGYCNPPKHTQWRQGKSGNPNGRPKKTETNTDGAVNAALFKHDFFELLQEEVNVSINGKTKRMPRQKAILSRLMNEASLGKRWAMIFISDLMQSYEKNDLKAMESFYQLFNTLVETEGDQGAALLKLMEIYEDNGIMQGLYHIRGPNMRERLK